MNRPPTPASRLGRLALTALPLLALPASLAGQDTKPIQVSLVTPVQIFSESYAIQGLRLNVLYGRSAGMSGIDIGVANHVTGDLSGIEVGLVNLVEAQMEGLQIGLYNSVQDAAGVQLGVLFGLAGVNEVKGRMQGLQVAVVNIGGTFEGLQFGLVNIADDMNGIQLGLVNIIRSKEELGILPIVNWKFDGE